MLARIEAAGSGTKNETHELILLLESAKEIALKKGNRFLVYIIDMASVAAVEGVLRPGHAH